MPRQARIRSETGIYHVILRGIDKSDLFRDDVDRQAFIDRLVRFKTECGASIFAWCLMDNHIHLLVKEGDIPLAVLMKKIEVSYVAYFNREHERVGYLFQNRFWSSPVETDSYLISATGYIHQNPLKIGRRVDYWTSYNEYLTVPTLTDTGLVLGLLASDPVQARRAFVELINSPTPADLPDIPETWPKPRQSDTRAIETILAISGLNACSELKSATRDERTKVLTKLRQADLSIRQIARVTGINHKIVAAAKPQR